MKNLLIFLPGKGSNREDENKDIFVNDVASRYKAEVLKLKAPIEYAPGKYCWYSKKEVSQDAIESDFKMSIKYVEKFINKEIEKRNIGWDNVILLGYSQGGVIAIEAGLLNYAKTVITVCSCIPYNVNYDNLSSNKATPIYWIEGGKDDYISQQRKDSYKLLLSRGINLTYNKKEKLTHTGFEVLITEDLN